VEEQPVSHETRPTHRVRLGIRRNLLRWYDANHRAFPWRETRDPWAVLVSEVMLQQTQAARVAERFDAFMNRFPTPEAMAAAPSAQVLAAWSGLGYNRRALALRRAATAITAAGWPTEVGGLEALPGVGRYTARAVAGLAFGARIGVVDTNVRRWLVRRFGLAPDVRSSALQRLADGLAEADGGDPAAWTHATMEFGAAICRARRPRCADCPIARGCPARGRPSPVPVRRQAGLAGSRRAMRGALVRRLTGAPGHRIALGTLERELAGNLDALVAGLERDGLAHRSGGFLRLGGAPEGEQAAATIRP
jgi:A/G-specific adenine glycosylase